jgi:hypothetical protein
MVSRIFKYMNLSARFCTVASENFAWSQFGNLKNCKTSLSYEYAAPVICVKNTICWPNSQLMVFFTGAVSANSYGGEFCCRLLQWNVMLPLFGGSIPDAPLSYPPIR